MSKLQTPKRVLRTGKSGSLVHDFRCSRNECSGNYQTLLVLLWYSTSVVSKAILPFVLLLAVTFFLSGCSSSKYGIEKHHFLVYVADTRTADLNATPNFIVTKPDLSFNKIGTPKVREVHSANSTNPKVVVSPAVPTLYYERQQFTTEKDTYSNEVYRIHFEKVPLGFPLFNITAGNNPGLLIIYTYNSMNSLVLITTLHTCGCYLAFFPTGELSKSSYPNSWPEKKQWVYGQTLPPFIQLDSIETYRKIFFTLESETHRISNAEAAPFATEPDKLTTMRLEPMSNLYKLPYLNKEISFFETEGPRKGYVRNNSKILERILISWWALDWRVGEDKAFGGGDDSDVILYTSLKFWDRAASDLKNFPRFLQYWGWDL